MKGVTGGVYLPEYGATSCRLLWLNLLLVPISKIRR